jgi:hypothetical protein
VDMESDFKMRSGAFIRFVFADNYFKNVRDNAVGFCDSRIDNLGRRHELINLIRIISKSRPRGKCYDRMLRMSLKS